MSINQQLSNRIREVILNGTIIANTNYKDQLTTCNWELATAKIGSLNTIAALTQHIHYYLSGVMQALEGGALTIKDKYSYDFPEIKSENVWEKILMQLWKDAEKFAILVEQLPEHKLNETFLDEKYGTYQRNIEAIIEHSYYHLGQIVLIKKMLLKK